MMEGLLPVLSIAGAITLGAMSPGPSFMGLLGLKLVYDAGR